MKKLSLLLLAVVSGLLCFAQPKIEFEKTTYDFGKIKEEGGKVTGKFVFKNVGNEPLELTNVRPGCGCTAANYSKGAIAPGEKGYIEATYNPYNRPGAFNKNIRVTTNEPQFIENEKATPHMIFIKGEVIKRKRYDAHQTSRCGTQHAEQRECHRHLLCSQFLDETRFLHPESHPELHFRGVQKLRR